MEKNTLIVSFNGTINVNINEKALEMLKTNIPTGCPFANYSLYDLLIDFLKMYSWKVPKDKQIKISDFVEELSKEYEKAAVYKKDIIACLQD